MEEVLCRIFIMVRATFKQQKHTSFIEFFLFYFIYLFFYFPLPSDSNWAVVRVSDSLHVTGDPAGTLYFLPVYTNSVFGEELEFF